MVSKLGQDSTTSKEISKKTNRAIFFRKTVVIIMKRKTFLDLELMIIKEQSSSMGVGKIQAMGSALDSKI